MGSVQNSLAAHSLSPPCCSQRSGLLPGSGRGAVAFRVRAEGSQSVPQERHRRRQILVAGTSATFAPLFHSNLASFAAEGKKGFQPVEDRKDGYTFLYPFGWQEVVVEGSDKVFKDVIEPLESVSVNLIPTTKDDIRDLGPPQQVAEALIKKVLAPSTQKTKLLEAAEVPCVQGLSGLDTCWTRTWKPPHDVDGKTYYTFEFVAQAPNFTRHALGTVTIGNGKFYTLTTGANERRWSKMKDRLHTVIDSFKISNVL